MIAQDLTPEAGDNVELTLVVVDSNGAMAVDETCIVQVFSQPGSDASVAPLVILTGADGEATTTLFAGSTPGAVEVSAQCGNTPAAVITLNVGGASVPASFPKVSIAAVIAGDLTPEAGDNVELTLVVVESNDAMAVNETCIVQVFSQPGSDASVEPLVTLTGANGEARTTLFAGSTPGAVEVSAQCGNTRAAVITLNVGGASVPVSFPGVSIAAFIAQDLTPEAGDNVELAVVVVEPNGAMAENEICIVQVLSQPGSDASINPMVVTTGADGEATTTLIVGSTPGVIEVSTQCGAVPAAVITLNVAGASVPASAPASLPDTGAGSLGSVAEPVDFWPVLMVALAGALIAAAGFLSFRRQTQLLPHLPQPNALLVLQDQPQESEPFVPRMRRPS